MKNHLTADERKWTQIFFRFLTYGLILIAYSFKDGGVEDVEIEEEFGFG